MAPSPLLPPRTIRTSTPAPVTTPAQGRCLRRLAATLVVAPLIVFGAGCGSGGDATTAGGPDTTGTADVSTTAAKASTASNSNGSTTPGSDAAVAEVDADVDACALLEGVDIESIIGVPVAEAVTEETYGDFVCDVRPADPSVRAQFKVVVDTDNGASNYPRQYDMAADPEEVTGLGDQAFRAGPNLFVLDGSTLVHVNVVRAETASGELTTEQLTAALKPVVDGLAPG